MRKIALIAALALAAPPAAALANGSSAHNSAEQQCRAERTHMGVATFKAAFGSGKSHKNAFGRCVSHRTQQNSSDEGQAQNNAAKQCKAEESDSSFSESHGGKSFDQFYGTNDNSKNAFGKCVSSKAKSMSEATENQQVSAEESAAAQCRSQQSSDAATFKSKFGTKSDAFGKCVSQTARQQEQSSS